MALNLLEKVQNAIGNGILMPQHYEDAISATRNDPEVTQYLRGLMIPEEQSNPNPRSVREITSTEEPTSKGTNPRAAAVQSKVEAEPEVEVIEQEAVAPTKGRFTLEDIQGSETLRRAGVVSGDLYDGTEITRVFSKDEDNVDLGYRLTEKDIFNSPNLQKLNAKVGDRALNGEIIPTNLDNAWMQFKYGMSEEQGFVADVGDFLESRIPIGELNFDFNVNSFADLVALPLNMASYVSPDELYGEGFSQAAPAERRDMIIAKKERELMHDYGQFFEPNEDSMARVGGNVVGVLADPTTLAPAGQSYKAMAGIGAAVAGSASVAKDLATKDEIDWERAGLSALTGGVAAPVIGKGVNTIISRSADKSARKLQAKAQATINTHIASGGGINGVNDALLDVGINPDAVATAVQRTGQKMVVPNSASKAEQAVKDAVTRDHSTSRLYSKTLDKYLGALSTRMGNISEGAKGLLRRFEFDSHVNTAAVSRAAEPFLRAMKELPSASKRILNKHLANGNFKAAEGMMRTLSPNMHTEFQDTIKPLLKRMGKELKEQGHTFREVENYFPRLVKDYDSLRRKLGKKEQGVITKQIQAYARKKKVTVESLSDKERSEVIDLAMRGFNQTLDGGKLRFAKQRMIQDLTDDLMDEYANPEEALAMYLRNAVADIEKRKFFGRSNAITLDEQGRFTTEGSIGEMIRKSLDSGELAPEREVEMAELLKARFVGGEQSPSGVASTIRDLGYLGTIANPVSAITQLADVGIAASLKGFRNAIGSMFGTKQIGLIDLGIQDLITTELSQGDPRMTAKVLNKLMGASLFKWTDRLGKETLINASFKKAQQMVKSTKGEAKFRQKIGQMYGDETEALIADLKSGDITENVKFFAFNELSDVQPVSLSELPEKYLNAKNGRLFYMLKSFTLKQIDVVRKDIVQEWGKGNKVEAVKRAALLAGYLSTSNMGTQAVKDTILGREVYADDIPDKALWALLGGFGMSEYTWDRYLSQGKIVGGSIDYLAPATPVIESLLTLGYEATEDEPNYSPVLKGIPYVGPILYSYIGGGAENYNERQDKRRDERRYGN